MIPRLEPHERLVLIRGVPGTGKSTLGHAICLAHPDTCRVEADMYFVHPATNEYRFDANKLQDAHDWCQATTWWLLDAGYRAVVCNTSIKPSTVWDYLAGVAARGLACVIIDLGAQPLYSGIHDVPSERIKQFQTKYVPNKRLSSLVARRFPDARVRFVVWKPRATKRPKEQLTI